jgi:hypothetical protein
MSSKDVEEVAEGVADLVVVRRRRQEKGSKREAIELPGFTAPPEGGMSQGTEGAGGRPHGPGTCMRT